MTRFGRRTFLTSSAGVAAGAAVLAGEVLPAGPGVGAAQRVTGVLAGATSSGPLRAGRLTVNGLTNPVGIDPDDCSFAWVLQATGRAVRQTGFRLRVRRVDPGQVGTVWDSGTVVSARQTFVAYGGPRLAADAAYRWDVQARDAAGAWGPVSARRV